MQSPQHARRKVLLTGRPGSGKTTVVRRTIDCLGDQRLAGFYTEEIREDNARVGFRAIGLGGMEVVLAHRRLRTGIRVGAYGVEVQGFEPLIAAELERDPAGVDIFIVDEIGPMECYSQRFVKAMHDLLERPQPLLATIALAGNGFVDEVKARPDLVHLTVTPHNRDQLPAELAALLAHPWSSKP